MAQAASSATLLDGYLRPAEVAREIGCNLRTLSRWHRLRIGPPRIKVGRLILYPVAAFREWLASRVVVGDAAGGRQRAPKGMR